MPILLSARGDKKFFVAIAIELRQMWLTAKSSNYSFLMLFSTILGLVITLEIIIHFLAQIPG